MQRPLAGLLLALALVLATLCPAFAQDAPDETSWAGRIWHGEAPFAEDNLVQAFGFGYGFGDDKERALEARYSLGYYLFDWVSLHAELTARHFHIPDGETAVGIALSPIIRLHPLARPWGSVFVDGGVGAMLATERVPENGTSFNFQPQVGAGASLRISEDARLVTGVRWVHTSNAGVFGPGRNAGMEMLVPYLDFAWEF